MEVKSHYEKHLADFYSWMFGDFEAKTQENQAFFDKHGIKPTETGGVALDLGAGTGFQSIPLARSGFKVKAVDFSKNLLQQLSEKSGDLDIETIECDLLDYDEYAGCDPELIVCMGDTLTHLPYRETVRRLVAVCSRLLSRGGKLVLSFRDFHRELSEADRFIPVHSDENRIMTCFLEYFNDYVKVYDIIHEKKGGKWERKISSYNKLKISSAEMKRYLENDGFRVTAEESAAGMIVLIAEK